MGGWSFPRPGLRHLILAVVGICVVATIAYAIHNNKLGLFGLDGSVGYDFFEYWLFNAVYLLAAIACLLRAVWLERDRWAWVAIGTSLALWGAADIYWAIELAELNNKAPYPSIADAIWALSYIPYFVGIILFLHSRIRERSVGLWLDGIIGMLAVGAVGVAVLAPALEAATHGDPAAVLTNLAYPIGDILLLMLTVGVSGMFRVHKLTEWTLIAGALVVLALADGFYVYLAAEGADYTTPIDWLWLVSATMIAIAAASNRPDPPPAPGQYRSLLFPVLFAAVVVGLHVYELLGDGMDPIASALAIGAIAAVVIRLMVTSRENHALLRRVRREATTDPLTGLRNRRRLVHDLAEFFEQPDPQGRESVFAIFDLDGFKSYNDTFGHPAGDLLLQRVGRRLDESVAGRGRAYRLGGDEFCILGFPGVSVEALVPGAVASLAERGESFTIATSYGVASVPAEAADAPAALHLVDERMYARKRGRRASPARQAHDVLARAIREREPELSRHQDGVGAFARALGLELGIRGEELEVLVRAAELHDVGKVAIPDAILQKPAKLDDDEWELLRRHTLIGERIIAAAPAMAPVARLVRSSHERIDGRGYPDGLGGEEIPLGSRIIFVCDAFEAMTSTRPYSRAMSNEEALAELRRHAGTQFDAEIVERFCALFEEPRGPLAVSVPDVPSEDTARARA